jgi:hypothetical protein
MKKVILPLVLGLILLVAFGLDAKAQIPKEGIISSTAMYTSTYQAVLPLGQDRVALNYEVIGVEISDTGEGITHNASFRCFGSLLAIKGAYENDSFYCVHTRPDGDQIFQICKSSGVLGKEAKGTVTIIGGTGKLTGAQGNLEFTRTLLRPVAQGTFQGIHKYKGQYKLP